MDDFLDFDRYKPVITDIKCDKCDVLFCKPPNDFQDLRKCIIGDLVVAERNVRHDPTDTTIDENARCLVRLKQLRNLENQMSEFVNQTDVSMVDHEIADKFECLNCSRNLCRNCVCNLEQRRAIPCVGSMKYYDYLYHYEGGEIECVQGQDIPITCPYCDTEDNRSYTMGYDHDETVRFTNLLQEIRQLKTTM